MNFLKWWLAILGVLLLTGTIYIVSNDPADDKPDTQPTENAHRSDDIPVNPQTGYFSIADATLTPAPAETVRAAIISSQATIDAWTPMPTAVASEEIATAESIFNSSGNTEEAFFAALEVLRFSEDPSQLATYHDYLASLAEAVVNSELPFPYVDDLFEITIAPTATLTSADVTDLAYTTEFTDKCEESSVLQPPDYHACAYFAGTLAPQRITALKLVPEEVSVPIARDGLQHPNSMVSLASIGVLCFYQADQYYAAIEAHAPSLEGASAEDNIALARSLGACDDPALDALGIAMLDDDAEMYNVLKAEALSKLP